MKLPNNIWSFCVLSVILSFISVSSQTSNKYKQIISKRCNNNLGFCVPSSACSSRISSRISDLDIRVDLNKAELTNECHYLENCCEPENIISISQGQSVIVDQINQNSEDTCIQKCKATTDSVIKIPPKFEKLTLEPGSQFCGYRNIHGVGVEHSNGPDVAQFGEFPWMTAWSNSGKYICGGSLIHPSVILTAAHCVNTRSAENLSARVGEWDTQTTNEPFPHADHTVKRIIVHPEFVRSNLHNDIALLLINIPVKLTTHINTICLPSQNMKFDGAQCLGTGWGAENYAKKDIYRVNLKKIHLPVVPVKECQDRLRSTVLGSLFKLHQSFTCAGGDTDLCIGDGGSPLVCPMPNEDNYYYQVGIVAWGIQCQTGAPGVYTNVAKFRNWIDNEMTQLGLGPEHYN